LHLLGVHHDHEIAGVGVGRERRAVLAAQHVRDLGRGAAEGLPLDVGDEPRARERLLGLIGRSVVCSGSGHKMKRGFYLSPAALSTCGAVGGGAAADRLRNSPMAAQARRTRSSFSISAKRTKPSPPGPNPTPGETATRARSSSSDANLTEPRRAAWAGRGAQTNIEATGSGTGQPTSSRPVQSSFARCL